VTWTLTDAHRWTNFGTNLLDEQMSTLSDTAAKEPSALPGWTRKALVAHICGNAEALGNLLCWAATGVETPMYASPEQRQEDIDSGDSMTMQQLLGWFGRSASQLADGMDRLTPEQWLTPVVTAQGRTVPAVTVPWLRAREVMVHAADLATGVTFGDLPAEFLLALCDDIVAKRNGGSLPPLHTAVALVVEGVERSFELRGVGAVRTVRGDLPQVAAYLAGRAGDGKHLTVDEDGSLPCLPPWL
jgi:maleylpyruvate isomerase